MRRYLTTACQVADRSAALYVHWPYCAKRCTYCNFNKYINAIVDHKRMRQCLLTETSSLFKMSGTNSVNSIYFGGGTPSLALPSTINDIVQCVAQNANLPGDAEITLELNPTMKETKSLREFQMAGVDRVSIGVQSLDKDALHLFGRNHSVEDSVRCIKSASSIFSGRVSIDLIFGRPFQTLESWKNELEQVSHLLDDHVSIYQLTVERGTALFNSVRLKQLSLPSNDIVADQYEFAVDFLKSKGFHRYEVSNFARNSNMHNKSYWSGNRYIGVGPGAHGRFESYGLGETVRQARIQTLEPEPWMLEVELKGHATRKIQPLSLSERLCELLLLGLRTDIGVTNESWVSLTKESICYTFAGNNSVVILQESDHIVLSQSGIRATNKGLQVLDSILPYLVQVVKDRFSSMVNAEALDSKLHAE